MTTKPPPEKNDGLLNFLTTVLKKSADSSESFATLVSSVELLAEQLKYVTKSIESIVVALQNQNAAIMDLYTVQEFLLKKEKIQDVEMLPQIKKPKDEKPN
jgi:hypothetical protein